MLLRPRLLIEAVRDGGVPDLIFATKFAPLMVRNGVRQIHSHFGDHKFFIGYYCKRLTGLPLSVTIHAHEFYTNPNPALFRKALSECDRIFPIAKRWCRILRQEYAVPEERIRLNHLFVDTDLYKPSNEIKVLAAGRFTERKGFRYLLEAARLLEDLDIRFLFVGFGEIDLCTMAEELGVAARVIVFPKMDQAQLRLLYQAVDILCVPSITTDEEGAEGIPVVLMEGMACGLPVVAAKCGAIDEIVEDFLIDERSSPQIAEAIRTLASDPELRKAQGERNRRLVEQGFSITNVDKFGTWLNEITNNKS
jgi:glycosyltransferase involved in cell wall biosynthesis